MVLTGADKMAKNSQKCWSQPGFEPGVFQTPKKVIIYCLKLNHCTELMKLSTKGSRINTKSFQNYLST